MWSLPSLARWSGSFLQSNSAVRKTGSKVGRKSEIEDDPPSLGSSGATRDEDDMEMANAPWRTSFHCRILASRQVLGSTMAAVAAGWI